VFDVGLGRAPCTTQNFAIVANGLIWLFLRDGCSGHAGVIVRQWANSGGGCGRGLRRRDGRSRGRGRWARPWPLRLLCVAGRGTEQSKYAGG
jgi:hypothetical protein